MGRDTLCPAHRFLSGDGESVTEGRCDSPVQRAAAGTDTRVAALLCCHLFRGNASAGGFRVSERQE